MRPLRLPLAIVLGLFVLLIAAPAWACGGLVNTNGSVTLVRTTTLAAYHRGVEHYVTSFEFAGGTGEFGSIIPLPGVPTKVIRGGDWTLQRLVQETQPQPEAFALAATAGAAEDRAQVILKTEIDALDIVVLEGGGTAVGDWAREHGFFLPPDAPEVLDFYAERSPIFMTVRFDASRAAEQGLGAGDGTPVHVVIPTTNPWVPLRILGLGAGPEAPVEADVYLLTDLEPATLPAPLTPGLATRLPQGVRPGLVLERSEAASASLLADLRDDKGMELAALERHVAQLPAGRRPRGRPRLRPRDRRERRRPAVARGRRPGPRGGVRSRRRVLVRTRDLDRDRGPRAPRRRSGTRTPPDRTPGGVRSAMRHRLFAVALVALAACAPASASTSVRTVAIGIHYSAFSLDAIDVEPGETVRFVVTNTDPIDHEFIIGDRAVQVAHELGTEAVHPPRPGEITIPAGETVSTTFTFGERDLLFGCHLPGHYVYGMRGTVDVV